MVWVFGVSKCHRFRFTTKAHKERLKTLGTTILFYRVWSCSKLFQWKRYIWNRHHDLTYYIELLECIYIGWMKGNKRSPALGLWNRIWGEMLFCGCIARGIWPLERVVVDKEDPRSRTSMLGLSAPLVSKLPFLEYPCRLRPIPLSLEPVLYLYTETIIKITKLRESC